jgi:hypothetical protein
MRSETMLALGLCLTVIGGIVYFAVTDRSPIAVVQGLGSGFSPRRAAEPEPEKDAAVAADAGKKAAVKTVAKRPGGGGTAVQSAPAPEPPAPVVASAPAPTPVKRGPQPAAKDLTIGMGRAELLRRYPDAAVHTSTIKDGDLIELLVYEGDGGGSATFAQLLNGEVKRVYTGMPTRPGKR